MKSNTLASSNFIPTVVLSLLISIAVVVLIPVPVFAQNQGPSSGGINQGSSPGSINQGSSPGSINQGPSSGGSRTIQNPLQVQSISQFISALLKAVIAIGVPIAILFIVLAGFKFVAAQGSPDKLSEARTNFMYVIIGIAIFIGASALAEIIMATLRQIGVNV